MDTRTVVVLVIVAAIVVVALWLWSQQRRSRQIRERFGPEYDRTIEEVGDRRRAEAELQARARRVEHLSIRALSPSEADHFSADWHAVQARFVDDPNQAIQDADRLVTELMRTRGYPMTDFDQRAADISVDHPHVVEHYRAAHAALPGWGKRDATTEELRQAMVHYRALFEELLESDHPERRVA